MLISTPSKFVIECCGWFYSSSLEFKVMRFSNYPSGLTLALNSTVDKTG